MQPFIVQRRVEFCETDAAGIAHFASLIIYLEQAEHALLRHLGLSVMTRASQAEPELGWPRVRVECDFLGSARFEDMLDIQVSIDQVGNKSVTYAFDVKCNDRPVCIGRVTSVCCKRESNALVSIPIPSDIKAKLATYLRT